MLQGKVTIFASGNRADITRVEKAQARTFAEYVRARMTKHSDHASAPHANARAIQLSDRDDRIAALERLAKLKEQGILTDEELKVEKKRILDH